MDEFVAACVNSVEGVTVSSATCVASITFGARYANMLRRSVVNKRSGARYWLMAFETPAIMVCSFRRIGLREVLRVRGLRS